MKKILFLIGIILLLGGCEMDGAKTARAKVQDFEKKKGLTLEELMMPENSEKVNDEFSGSKWTGIIEEVKYQIRFDPENNICRIYLFAKTLDPNLKKWFYTQFSCFRKNEDGKILFDFKPYIDYAESYSMEKCWIELYVMVKYNYEYGKEVFETTKDPEVKERAKKWMEENKKNLEQFGTFESFKNHEKADEAFQSYKKYHAQRAAGLKAVNPVIGTLSADKKTLTLKKMFLRLKKDDTPEYAENVVFTRK